MYPICTNLFLIIFYWLCYYSCPNFSPFAPAHPAPQLLQAILTPWLNIQIKLGRTDILTTLSLPSYERGIFLHYLGFYFYQFYSYFYIDLVHILLDLYISISFVGVLM